MKSKTTLVLFVVFTILLLVVILVERAGKDRAQEAKRGRPLFADYSADKAQRIEISGMNTEVILNKKKGEWVVATSDDYPADPAGVDQILEKVQAFERKDIASKLDSKHKLFQVTPEDGIHTRIFGEGDTVLADFYIGKTGPDFRSTYVRAEGSPEVVLIPESLRSVFYRGTRTWRDRRIFDFPRESVISIEINKEDETFALSSEDGQAWKIVTLTGEEIPAKKQRVDTILSNFSKLLAEEWPEKQGPEALTEYRLDPPTAVAVAVSEDGTKYTLLWGGENEKGQIYVKRDDLDTIFLVGQYRRNAILKNIEELRDDSAPRAPAPDAE